MKDPKNPSPSTILMKVNDFLYKANLDNLNLFKVNAAQIFARLASIRHAINF